MKQIKEKKLPPEVAFSKEKIPLKTMMKLAVKTKPPERKIIVPTQRTNWDDWKEDPKGYQSSVIPFQDIPR